MKAHGKSTCWQSLTVALAAKWHAVVGLVMTDPKPAIVSSWKLRCEEDHWLPQKCKNSDGWEKMKTKDQQGCYSQPWHSGNDWRTQQFYPHCHFMWRDGI